VLVYRILAREARVGEQVAERYRVEVHSIPELDRRSLEVVWRAEPRQKRGGGSNDDLGASVRDGVQRSGARRGNAEVGRDVAIRVDVKGRKRFDGILERGGRGAFEGGQEESGVDAELIDVLVSRDDDDAHRILAMARPRGDIQGLGGWRQAAHVRRRRIHSRPGRGGLEKGLKIERGGRGHAGREPEA
jgi:hypothetical protein